MGRYSRQPVAAAGQASWPLTGMGVEANWAFTGTGPRWSFTVVAFALEEGADGDFAELTGAAKDSFDAAVSNSTACSVTVATDESYEGGDIAISLKGGTPVEMDLAFGTNFTKTITSGTGSGFRMTQLDVTGVAISNVTITLA